MTRKPIAQEPLAAVHRLGAVRERNAEVERPVAMPGWVFAADVAPGQTVLVPVKVTKVAATETGVELTFEGGEVADYDDITPLRVS